MNDSEDYSNYAYLAQVPSAVSPVANKYESSLSANQTGLSDAATQELLYFQKYGTAFGVGMGMELLGYDVDSENPGIAMLLGDEEKFLYNSVMAGNTLPGYSGWLNEARLTFGDSYTEFRLNNPEIAALEQVALTFNWDRGRQDTFAAALGETGRSYLLGDYLRQSGGGGGGISREQNIANLVAQISDGASQLGVQLTTEEITDIATAAVDNNWDTTVITDNVMAKGSMQPYLPGNITANITLIKNIGAGLRLDVSDELATDLAERLSRGEITSEGIDATLRLEAAQANPEFAPLLQAGLSVVDYDNMKAEVSRVAQQLGLDLTDQRVGELAFTIVRDGLDQAQTTTLILDEITDVMGLESTGQIAANANILKTAAARNLIGIGDQAARDYALRIARGEISQDAVEQLWVDSAKAQYGFAASALDRGLSMYDYFLPAMQQVASELEMNINDLDLTDADTMGMFVGYEDSGSRPLSITESLRAARSMPDWQGTQKARDSLSQMVQNVSSIFGRSVI